MVLTPLVRGTSTMETDYSFLQVLKTRALSCNALQALNTENSLCLSVLRQYYSIEHEWGFCTMTSRCCLSEESRHCLHVVPYCFQHKRVKQDLKIGASLHGPLRKPVLYKPTAPSHLKY
ncbi:hypothetical protein C0J52_08476 [Blattella germanica]|nr:hypothetical protein C0J52_08476 [Blattella germanica]